MKMLLSGAALTVMLFAVSSFSTSAALNGAARPNALLAPHRASAAFPIALSQLTLDRIVYAVVSVTGGLPLSLPFSAAGGVAITEVAMEPDFNNVSQNDRLSSKGLQISVNGMTQTTACFLPETWDNSSGGRCNTKDRRVKFETPIIVRPGDRLTLTLFVNDQGSGQWIPAAGSTTGYFSVSCYVLFPGEV